MNLLQTVQPPANPQPDYRRWLRKFGWLVLLSGTLTVSVVGLQRLKNDRIDPPSLPSEATWWQGLHTPVNEQKLPRLQLALGTKSQATGFLEISFNVGFDIRLPVLTVMPSATDVIFSVEDPHSYAQPRGQVWYVLHKTGATTSTLYRLNRGYLTPTAGTMIPTNLDQQHYRVANMTTDSHASTNR